MQILPQIDLYSSYEKEINSSKIERNYLENLILDFEKEKNNPFIQRLFNENNPEANSRLIIDNTFASPVLLNIAEIAKKYNSAKWVGVESATKHYQQGMDNITAGIVYSDNAEYIQKVKDKRSMVGTNLQDKLVSFLPKPDAEMLSQKMMRHSMNALLLSSSLEKLGLEINYPSLESHVDNKNAAKEYSEGAGGVFFIKWNNKDGNPQKFVNKKFFFQFY